jgi:hypothetical protein
MPTFGVYPIADVEPAGQEVSSTYEGRHVTLLESELIHNAHADGLVDKGDPVVFGTVALQGVGVAFKSAAAATDLITVDTEGIWIIDCFAQDDGGASAIEGGDRLYIANSTPCIVSKIATAATQVPFGYALGHVGAGLTETIAVKVHWDPIDNAILDLEPFYFGDSRDASLVWGPSIINAGVDTLLLTVPVVPAGSSAFQIKATAGAGTNDVGIACYFDANVGGVQTGNWVYGGGIWLNLATTFDAPAAYEIAAQNNGVYCGAVVDYATARVIYGLKAECIMSPAQPRDVYAFGIGGNISGSADTAIFYAAQPAICGMTPTNRTTQVGSLALIRVNGSGHDHVLYVNLYEA